MFLLNTDKIINFFRNSDEVENEELETMMEI